MTNQPLFYKSRGGGQFFKKEGRHIKIICLYGFNPSVERTTFDEKLLVSLECEPCDEETFNKAEAEIVQVLQLDKWSQRA
ncbi:hypothetical protein [Arundinibacter roseus]|uniref:Uncharacterized protein n=1 Tax=Arundinibacter roseus TaxID=2070510 RepID=A0A4R4K4Z8_9BACT|nr:hypothetical protein [Arundinibacter roseus]TDB62373.1 hypothetical protein EZE20_18500 [Arundinibacter roseus]